MEFCRTSQILRQTGTRPKIPSRWFNLWICHYPLYSCCQLLLLLTDPCESLYSSTDSLAMDLPKPSEGEEHISDVHYPTRSTFWSCSLCFTVNWIHDDHSDLSVETVAGQMAHSTVEGVGMGLARASSFCPLRPIGIHGCEKR